MPAPFASRRLPRRRPGHSRGVSLVEVLVSILLMAVGLLALVGSNVASIRYSKLAQYRATASLLATDIAERMRANRNGLAEYAVQLSFAVQATEPAADTRCESYIPPIPCDATRLAQYDLVQWRHVVRNQLPEGSVFITPRPVDRAADVWIVWRDIAVAQLPAGEVSDAPRAAGECANGLDADADLSIRCSYFRINL